MPQRLLIFPVMICFSFLCCWNPPIWRWRDLASQEVVNAKMTKERNKKPTRKKPAFCFANYPGVFALKLANLGLCGGADLGSNHLARYYQLDAPILLTAFRGAI
jgi:hypothetical protein